MREGTMILAPAECPVCHEYRETVFFRVDDDLVCRCHPDHPLSEDRQRLHQAEVYPPLPVST
jgi:hypothetical protein